MIDAAITHSMCISLFCTAGGGLSALQESDVQTLAATIQLRIAQAKTLVEELESKERGDGSEGSSAAPPTAPEASSAIDDYIRGGVQ